MNVTKSSSAKSSLAKCHSAKGMYAKGSFNNSKSAKSSSAKGSSPSVNQPPKKLEFLSEVFFLFVPHTNMHSAHGSAKSEKKYFESTCNSAQKRKFSMKCFFICTTAKYAQCAHPTIPISKLQRTKICISKMNVPK